MSVAEAAYEVVAESKETWFDPAWDSMPVITMDQDAYLEMVTEFELIELAARPDLALGPLLAAQWEPREFPDPWLGFSDVYLWGCPLFLVATEEPSRS